MNSPALTLSLLAASVAPGKLFNIRLSASLSLIAIAALAACSKKDNTSSTDTTAVTASSTASATDTLGTASPAAGSMSDANILAQESDGDSAEVVIGQYARTHAADAQVKAYAKLLVDDHGKGLKEVHALAKKLSITPQPPAEDTASQETTHTLQHFAMLKGRDFDTAFVAHEIADHKADIDDAKKAAAAAQNPEVKQLVEKSLPELQKHLDRAQALEKKK